MLIINLPLPLLAIIATYSNMAVFHKNIKTDQLTIFTAEMPVEAPEIRKYIIKNWKKISVRLDNSTVLFSGGVHGGKSGNLGENANNMGSIKNQVSVLDEQNHRDECFV